MKLYNYYFACRAPMACVLIALNLNGAGESLRYVLSIALDNDICEASNDQNFGATILSAPEKLLEFIVKLFCCVGLVKPLIFGAEYGSNLCQEGLRTRRDTRSRP